MLYLLHGGVDSLGTLPLELLIGVLASLIVLLEFLLHRGDSLCHLLPVCLVRVVLSPQVGIPAKEMAGEDGRLKSLLYLGDGSRGGGGSKRDVIKRPLLNKKEIF